MAPISCRIGGVLGHIIFVAHESQETCYFAFSVHLATLATDIVQLLDVTDGRQLQPGSVSNRDRGSDGRFTARWHVTVEVNGRGEPGYIP